MVLHFHLETKILRLISYFFEEKKPNTSEILSEISKRKLTTFHYLVFKTFPDTV